MSDALERRARQYRSRLLIRACEYRQRHGARGVWYRLRRLLVDAERVYVVSATEMAQLADEGNAVESVGSALQPAKVILWVPHDRIARIPSARELAVSLNSDLLHATSLVLVRCADVTEASGGYQEIQR